MEELPPEVFSFQGVEDLLFPVKIELKDDKVDLSSAIQSINRIKQSYYRNTRNKDGAFEAVFERVKLLCAKSKNEDNCQSNSMEELESVYQNIEKEMSKSILYPRWYREDNQKFTEALNALNSRCAASCTNYDIADSIVEKSDAEYRQLYDKIKSKNEDCQKNILQAVAKSYSFYSFPKKCLEEGNKRHPVCDNMLKIINTAKNRFVELVQLVYGEDVLVSTEARTICLECVSSKDELAKDLYEIIEVLRTNDQCRKLKPNQEKKVRSGTWII